MLPVSVVIPAFNSGRYIGEALDSIRRQSVPPAEVIVVDDGSADDTLNVADRFAGALGLRILRQPNGGPAAARNAGVRASTQRYCAFLDADDLMLPTRLEEQASMLEADARMALVHTDLMTFDERGVVHKSRRVFSDPCGGEVLERLVLDNFITTSTVMARRDALLSAGLFREGRHISEDFELWLRIAERWPLGYIEHPLVMYRYTPGSLSGNKLRTAMAALEVVEEFWQARPDLRRAKPRLMRRSLSRHQATAGWAALREGQRVRALRHLSRALRLDPASRQAWRGVIKALVAPAAPPRVPGGGAGIGNQGNQ
ncbi:MAG: glycosyltransferase family 2 protein [Proteobacteria bacterium]|nr:glycosyltransferase family 2 protein [Pseudomonadota bacterium]